MKRAHAIASVALLAALGSGAALACTFPSVTYANDASLADAGVDAVEEAPPPDFPDADPDVYNPCDIDQDGYKAIGCDGGKDCNDHDKRVHPGQDFLPDVPNGPPDGDWNCVNGIEPQYPTVTCGVTSCNAAGFQANPGCGISATYVTCSGVLCAAVEAGTRVQGCR